VTYESPEYVQFFLDQLEPMQYFAVMFAKQDGTQSCYIGTLDPNGETRKVTIPFRLEDGTWKSFSKERVLWIGYPDDCQGLMERLSNAES